MKTGRFFETSVSVDNSSPRNIPEGLNIQQQGTVNVVSYSLTTEWRHIRSFESIFVYSLSQIALLLGCCMKRVLIDGLALEQEYRNKWAEFSPVLSKRVFLLA